MRQLRAERTHSEVREAQRVEVPRIPLILCELGAIAWLGLLLSTALCLARLASLARLALSSSAVSSTLAHLAEAQPLLRPATSLYVSWVATE